MGGVFSGLSHPITVAVRANAFPFPNSHLNCRPLGFTGVLSPFGLSIQRRNIRRRPLVHLLACLFLAVRSVHSFEIAIFSCCPAPLDVSPSWTKAILNITMLSSSSSSSNKCRSNSLKMSSPRRGRTCRRSSTPAYRGICCISWSMMEHL